VDKPCLICLKDSSTFLSLGFNSRKDLLLDSYSVLFSTWFSDPGIEAVYKANSAALLIYLHVYQVCIIEDIEDWRQ
jgi:hypothetical protein